MFELRKVVEFEPDTGHSQSDRQLAGVSQMVMSSFIEDLIPGTVVHAPFGQCNALAACMLTQSLPFQCGCLYWLPGPLLKVGSQDWHLMAGPWHSGH